MSQYLSHRGAQLPRRHFKIFNFQFSIFNPRLPRLLSFLTALLAAQSLTFATLPPGWTAQDLGAVGQAGAASFNGGTWVISASGTDICSSDQMQFAYKPISGDGTITARLGSITNAANAQAGVMLRNDTTSGALEVSVLATATNGVTFQWRSSAGPGCSFQVVVGVPNLGAPVWLRLTRAANVFGGFWSTNNVDWYQVGSYQTISMNTLALGGLVVSANNNAVLSTAVFTDVALPIPAFGIYRELWDGLSPAPGDSLAALTNTTYNPNWPNNPNPAFNDILTVFETQTNSGLNYYGQRLRAFVVPPVTGDYTFSIASDNTSGLWVSQDEFASHANLVASVNTATAPRDWTHEPNQKSAPITFQAGRRYYLEALMQQSTGSDNLAVRWRLPDGTYEEPMTALSSARTVLVPCRGVDSPPGIYSQPTNLVVSDGRDAVFSLLVTNQGPVSYRWQGNGTNLPSATSTNAVYVLGQSNPQIDNNRLFTCIVSNAAGSVTSSPALLTVIADTTPPTVVRGLYLNSTNVQVVFSEPMEIASATNTGNYVLTNGVPVQRAILSADGLTATLTTGPLVSGSNYLLVINGLRDRASNPNPIAANTKVSLFAGPYTSLDIGSPTPSGSILGASGGVDLTGGGRDIGGISDQFQFAYETRSGNFDIKVRLQSLSQTDAFAKAGLMAREDLTPGSRFVAAFATPSISGSFFEYRTAPSANALLTGNAQVNYPDSWLRLSRVGDQFTGYTSYDGLVWQQLGSANIAMTNPLYFGMAVCSHNTNQAVTAQFRELSTVTNASIGVLSLANEPAGPSSRRTGLVISEIMYHPPSRVDGRKLEFIEIFNPQPFQEDISGYSITGDAAFTFPSGTKLGAGAYLVVAAAPADVQTVYGISNVTGPYTNNLSNSSGTVRLRNRINAILLEVNYDSVPPWPAATDGAGHSLVLSRPSYGEGNPMAWSASDRKGGSPGASDGVGPELARSVVINEFLAHTDPPLVDAIELFNRSSLPADVSGCYLSDDRDTNKFRIPSDTVIPARGFLAFDENQLGFRFDAAGETLYFVNSNNTRILDAIRFEGQANGVSTGRSPDGSAAFRPLTSRTLGTNNSPPALSSIVINEIMYDPISGNDDDQYVELYNRSGSRIDLAGWRFNAGINFNFPSNSSIAANGYLVVARNASRLLTNYPNLNSGNLIGNFEGSLAGRGERLALAMPDDIVSTNSHGIIDTNTIHIVVNEVTYNTGGRWGRWANSGGSSLELINPDGDNSFAPNWADSDETAKAPWTTVEATGVLDLGNFSYPPDQLQLFLQDDGECLVDNVEVFRAGEGNRITNPNFDTGTTGWFFQGSQAASSLEASGGYNGGPCLHVRASHRGDTGANRIRTVLSPSLAAGNTATLRAKVRWLKGSPEILLRLHGNWLEAAGRMEIPSNLGTPGARNSRYTANAGPAIVDVSHTPILPAAGQSVVVTARVADPNGIGSVTLTYRNDSANGAPVSIPMNDDSANGDQFAGDGIFSASIAAQTAGTLVAFYVQATDAALSPGTSLFPSGAPARECLVRFGEASLPGSLGTYRTWITRANTSAWSARERNSNAPLDATFVYGNFRVVYNIGTYYSGSPFHTSSYSGPTGSPCDYVLEFPDDDRMLGANDFVLATVGNLGNDTALQHEQAAFWMLSQLGVPSLHRRFVYMFVNGLRRGVVMEDAQQPNSDIVEEHFPDDDKGRLHKVEDWFEFDNTGGGFVNIDATLDDFTTTGGAKKVARYRWNWRPRAVQSTANDFTNVFRLVDALHAAQPEPYTSSVEWMMDVDEWMRTLALERFAGNWDSFAYSRGKNLYAYKPDHGPWQLIAWDIDFVLGLSSDGTTTGLFGGQDFMMDILRSFPPFQRAYWRAFQDLVDGPAQDARIGPVLDAKYNGLVANGVSVSSPAAIKTWVSQRRSYLQSQLNSVAATFSITSVTVNNNVATISGTAPVKVKSILFNGAEYPITWTSVTGWTATVPLVPGANPFSVLGIDYFGAQVSGASNYVNAVYSGTLPSPAGQVVINEIMYQPTVPNGQFVELFNNSSTVTYDLSSWEFRGLSYTFPPGAILGPRNYLVLAADRSAAVTAYGSFSPVFDVFSGTLQTDGETLTLIKPGATPAGEVTVAKVRYDGALPWPAAAASTGGSSLQLIDPRQDNWRVGNWTAVPSNSLANPQWVYVTATGTASTSTLYIYLQSAGDVYVDDIQLVSGSTPGLGQNLLPDGDFESGFPGPWTVSPNLSASALSTSVKHGGSAGLHVVSSSAGSTQGSAIWQTISPALTVGAPYSLSFWYLQSTNGGPLTLRLSGSGIVSTVDPAPPGANLATATPGAANSVVTTLPTFPTLWMNELQAENLTGITNRLGQRVPWLEIFNPGTNTVGLSNLFLACTYTNLTQWSFPSTASIGPGQFRVIFADGQTNLTTATEWHANFLLPAGSGSVALSRLYNNQPQTLDYVNYSQVPANRSYGSFADAQSFARQVFFYATPGASNNATSPPLTVAINEWMADNTRTLADPADEDYEDWFELYNPGTNAVDLGGFFLTDAITNKFQFEIPNNGHYVIPPHGFLLVWADSESSQNSSNRADLHVNFKLDKAGEAIGLFAADGTTVDYVTFGQQVTDLSMGRYPDGSPNLYVLPFATARTNNPVPNTPPELDSIPDEVLVLGQSLSLNAVARDNDFPPQSLAFSLGPGAPPGVSIDAASGHLSWTPVNAPVKSAITVMVTDNGSPSMTATQSFQVTVYLPPQVQNLSLEGSTFIFSWMSLQGQLYQVEYTDDLASQNWAYVGPAQPGTGDFLTVNVDARSSRQRYFRVRILGPTP